MAEKSSNFYIPYGRQSINSEDEAAILEVLRSDWLTTGPKVTEFEKAFADFCNAKEAVAVSSGTAALHCSLFAINLKPGDEVIVPTLTFAATANAALYLGAKPVFADVDPETLLIDPDSVASLIGPKTRAIIAVDYAGQACNYQALRQLAEQNNLKLIADACHAPGGKYQGQQVGTLADLNTFSFHPVKHLTTAEGGMITTSNPKFADRMRVFRNHGITTDHRQRDQKQTWFYEMTDLGFNYRLSDLQCALGISQLKKMPDWLEKRRNIAKTYDQHFTNHPHIRPLKVRPDVKHAYHLYVVQVPQRDTVFKFLRENGIGCNVHYIPVHLHPYYRKHLQTQAGDCPQAEKAFESILSLPMYPQLSEQDFETVLDLLEQALTQI